KDSYYYYGPNLLWEKWHPSEEKKGTKEYQEAAAQRLGRDTWIHWTWGNQKVVRKATVLAGHLPVPVSIDLFRLLDSRNRGTRFRDLGLINEPNCKPSLKPDRYGLYLDQWDGDPYDYYPGNPKYGEKYGSTYPGTKVKIDERHYGR